MDILEAIINCAEISCANETERNQVLAILDNNGLTECLKGVGDPDGKIIMLFPDSTYMIDNELSSANVVSGEEIINHNLHIA